MNVRNFHDGIGWDMFGDRKYSMYQIVKELAEEVEIDQETHG